MNKVTVRAPANKVIYELGVPYEEAKPGLDNCPGQYILNKQKNRIMLKLICTIEEQ